MSSSDNPSSSSAASAAGPEPSFMEWAWNHKLMMLPIVFALMASLCGGCFGLAYISAVKAIRDHPLHKMAVEKARENEKVVAAVGTPLEGQFISEGTLETNEDQQSGYADCVIPISGPRGRARLLTKAELAEGKWNLQELAATIEETGEVIKIFPAPEDKKP